MSAFAVTSCQRLVIKVGSSLLIDADAQLNRAWLDSLVDDICEFERAGQQILVVSSGAIALGSRIIGINRRRAQLGDLQAAAAAGQTKLVHAWQQSLARYKLSAAQVLLTLADTEHRRRFLNARSTLTRLLDRGVVPVINENDTVATEEIRYGDNDRLAARVAQLVMADALILFSDVDGLYTADPAASTDARHIDVVDNIDERIVAAAGAAQSDVGTGGMATKVQAAQIATHAGCSTIVASGHGHNPLQRLASGARCTVFPAGKSPAVARKQWLAGALDVAGELVIDAGAAAALQDGGSLLPVGVTTVQGEFDRGDIVRILDAQNGELGRGLTEYASNDAARIAGAQSGAIEGLLGYRGRAVMIHRDELVLFRND